ncbi:hypothetical protein LCGC14_1009470 [marine sediment metagenome]|uniref:Uncharacterized protein n=1 Tax=marine sediment metagenome TaxID=412755 RepID=A0A0F9R6U6_9ZZZZ|nr:hypothetical protein [Candidatus Aminicenantes bacterium]
MDLRKGSKTIICTSCGLPVFKCLHFSGTSNRLTKPGALTLDALQEAMCLLGLTDWNLELKKLVEEEK